PWVANHAPAAPSEPPVRILSGISTSHPGRQDTSDFRTQRYHRYLWVPSEHAARRKRAPSYLRPVCASLPSAASRARPWTTSRTPLDSPREPCTASSPPSRPFCWLSSSSTRQSRGRDRGRGRLRGSYRSPFTSPPRPCATPCCAAASLSSCPKPPTGARRTVPC